MVIPHVIRDPVVKQTDWSPDHVRGDNVRTMHAAIAPMHLVLSLVLLLVIAAGCNPPGDGSASSSAPTATTLSIRQDTSAGTIAIYRAGEAEPILTQNARPDFRPYLHPLVAPP
jgi:hypothetical protein